MAGSRVLFLGHAVMGAGYCLGKEKNRFFGCAGSNAIVYETNLNMCERMETIACIVHETCHVQLLTNMCFTPPG